MPYCPKCHYEYVEGIARCPECGTSLAPGAPPEPQEEVGPDYVHLITLTDPAAGLVFRAALEEAGIPTVMQTHGPITGPLAAVADDITEDVAIIYVPEDQLEAAQRVVEALEKEPTQWPPGMEPEE